MIKKTVPVSGFSKEQRKKELEKVKVKYEKKGYKFIEFIENGIAKSVAIFEVDDEIAKNEFKKKIKVWGLIIIVIILIISFSNDSKSNQMKITPNSLNKEWPFTIKEAVIKCYKDNDIKSPIVEINNTPFGLTGFADNMHGQSDINALNKYWRKNPNIKGTRIDLTEVTNKALSLCK